MPGYTREERQTTDATTTSSVPEAERTARVASSNTDCDKDSADFVLCSRTHLSENEPGRNRGDGAWLERRRGRRLRSNWAGRGGSSKETNSSSINTGRDPRHLPRDLSRRTSRCRGRASLSAVSTQSEIDRRR
ncbi:hypothetical protein LSAT2_014051 [Lamellibrachia satsuma]|nr:hypothetical protein LSAT2_014051 [Lamellibrachia satsuma]